MLKSVFKQNGPAYMFDNEKGSLLLFYLENSFRPIDFSPPIS